MHVLSLAVHPVKSTAIRPVDGADVGSARLVGDREWMVVDGSGELVSAREEPRLFSTVADCPATAQLPPDVALRLSASGMPPALVAQPTTGACRVAMHGKAPLTGRPPGAAADQWVGAVLGRDDVRLVWCADPTSRRLNAAYSREGDHAAFQDGYPVTLLTTASLAQLDIWLAEEAAERGEGRPAPIGAHRFRPNIVIDGAASAFAEDGWRRILVGDVMLRIAKLVDRCSMTTRDPQTLAGGREPLRTLARHRRQEGRVWFAVHAIPEVAVGEVGRVSVGDAVVVVA